MSKYTLQLRLQNRAGESIEDWIKRQRGIDLIQLSENLPQESTYDMREDIQYDNLVLNREHNSTWSYMLSLER
jgi:hypothetical protein